LPDCEVEPPRGFINALLRDAPAAIIAEAKKASPSKGVIRADFDPVAIARKYAEGGATCMSVLTDEHFFQGSLAFIAAVRQAVDLPVLRKDFIIHEVQIEQASKWGADAILLIAAILDEIQLRDYAQMATGLGMDVLTEIHNERELDKALVAGSKLIGINNRNLQDFSVDLDTTFRLKKEIPSTIPVVSESGIRNEEDMQRLAQASVTAVLIGETFMRSEDEGNCLKQFRDAVCHI